MACRGSRYPGYLGALTGDDRFQTAACAAMVYERRVFSPEAGKWRDLRDVQTSDRVAGDHQARFMGASVTVRWGSALAGYSRSSISMTRRSVLRLTRR